MLCDATRESARSATADSSAALSLESPRARGGTVDIARRARKSAGAGKWALGGCGRLAREQRRSRARRSRDMDRRELTRASRVASGASARYRSRTMRMSRRRCRARRLRERTTTRARRRRDDARARRDAREACVACVVARASAREVERRRRWARRRGRFAAARTPPRDASTPSRPRASERAMGKRKNLETRRGERRFRSAWR